MKKINIIYKNGYSFKKLEGGEKLGFLDDFINMFRGKKDKRNNTESNNNLTNMKDTHVSFGEDPGIVGNPENEEE